MTDEPVMTSLYCTNWGAFNTPRLWSMVEHENDEQGRQQVTAWRTLAGSVRSQQEALKTAKADLVAAWPPDQNASSAAFVQELDVLIGRLDSASADADATASGLDNIISAIQTAKTKLQPLWEQYKDKSTDLVPHWWDKAEDGIDSQARSVMIEAERAVEDSVSLLKVPDPYQLKIDNKVEKKPPAGSSSGSSGSASRGGIDVSVPHDPPPPMPGHEATVPDGNQGGNTGGSTGAGSAGGGGSVGDGDGPGLAGVITPSTPPGAPGGGGSIPLPTGGGGGLPTGGAPINPVVPGLLPTGGGAPISPGGGVRPARLSSGVIGEPGVGGGRGGLGPLGATGGRGGAGGKSRISRTGTIGGIEGASEGGRGVRGGLTGIPEEGLGAAGGRRGSTSGRSGRQPRPSWLSEDEIGPDRKRGMTGMPGRGGRRGQNEGELAFDPDNPWEVAEGVEPVIAPSTDNPWHDPGPNVIGWR
ncbi:hypothetical protein [Actinoplanes subtropicus]|uniref:hypothetical protein n=1 Tax=Actinoplanes subtropicus TaxID=543632 RepID=UPI0004C46461|nr:hypothetical protein [Actinoplanes subtropicus]